jgi:hypothetical protein
LGKDDNGKTRFAAMRSTTTNFKRDADGSDKRYGFLVQPSNPTSNEVAVFESPIEALSHQTLCKQGFIMPFSGWRLSLSGTSALALEYFLKRFPAVTQCIVCTNNDEAGNKVAANIKDISGLYVTRFAPLKVNDWNDMLQAQQKSMRKQQCATEHQPDKQGR